WVGEASWHVGYFDSVTPLTEISSVCNADTQSANDVLSSGENCKINVGSDLVVWTKHFTGFATWTSGIPAPVPSQGTSSSGAGGTAGSTGVGPSGTGVGTTGEFGGTLATTLKLYQISYDICDSKMVKIVVSYTDIIPT